MERKKRRTIIGQKDTVKDENEHKDGCPYVIKCGGCNMKDEDYKAHLEQKQRMVEQKLKSICKCK